MLWPKLEEEGKEFTPWCSRTSLGRRCLSRRRWRWRRGAATCRPRRRRKSTPRESPPETVFSCFGAKFKLNKSESDLLCLPRGIGAGLGEDELPLRLGDHSGAPRVGPQIRRHVHVHRENNLEKLYGCFGGKFKKCWGSTTLVDLIRTFQSVTFDVMFTFITVDAWAP